MILLLSLGIVAAVSASSGSKDNLQGYKDQYCTDPRTMRKHAAYTEWADAYSCSRHRCQPGGRNLAIYTVGCKRVEAPESAIECEEVVEDTNMQFPFCCTRLRCLVVVRGEVWTRVLGQPWEVLPAAPWSHMYKMKKPPPSDTTFTPKTNEIGPVYELSEPEADSDGKHEKSGRSGRKAADASAADCNEVLPRSAPLPAPAPDIVIALSTNNDKELNGKSPNDIIRSELFSSDALAKAATNYYNSHKRGRKSTDSSRYEKEDEHRDTEQDLEETVTEKTPTSEEMAAGKSSMLVAGPEPHPGPWDIPQSQWNEHEISQDPEPRAAPRKTMMAMALHYTQEPKQPEYPSADLEKLEKKEEPLESVLPKQSIPNKNLQALVDAIGTRMKDIESVVQRMSEKVRDNKKPPSQDSSNEKKMDEYGKERKIEKEIKSKYLFQERDRDLAMIDDDRFKPRYTPRIHESSKYHGATSSAPDPHRDDTSYFSDPSNAVRRASEPKEPPPSHATYMAPVETYRKAGTHVTALSDSAEDDKKKKKHAHKKKKSKAHKKHHDKRKRFNKLNSNEFDKNAVSMEDSSAVVSR